MEEDCKHENEVEEITFGQFADDIYIYCPDCNKTLFCGWRLSNEPI